MQASPYIAHLTDSALPTGGFAFSNGLESAAKHGFFNTPDDLKSYIQAFLKQLHYSEIPFVSAVYEMESLDDLKPILSEYDATVLIPEAHAASINQGKAWIRLADHIYDELRDGHTAEQQEALLNHAYDTWHYNDLIAELASHFGVTLHNYEPKLTRIGL